MSAYHPQERYPAGDYLHQCDGSDGIAAYVEKDRPIENADIVAWHVFGMHHLPRPEDFPVQPCIACGFRLMPCGFFDTNPCLGLPAARNRASCHTTSAREA